jgi:hypothetical protein
VSPGWETSYRTLEVEIRQVLALRGPTPPAGPDDWARRLRRRIERRRRLRPVLVVITALAAVAGVAVGVRSIERAGRPVPVAAAAASAPEAVPSALRVHYRGYRLRTQQTIAAPKLSFVDLRFTPDTWEFAVGVACQGSQHVSVSTYVFDRFLSTQPCAPAIIVRLATATPGADARQYWQRLGVRLGAPVAVTVRLGVGSDPVSRGPGSARAAARATVGMYVPVRT